jgi:quercetin dioxygenase-like cupin family protein
LDGDPTAPGIYTLRRRLPAGYYGPPHYHPHVEYATVISGTLYVAVGDSLERAAAVALPPGSFLRVPPFTAHAVWTEGEVILHFYGPGPRKVVNGTPPR